MRYADKGMDLHPIDSLSQIVRSPSPQAWARKEYIQQKKSGGCHLCGSKYRLAFYHRDPDTKDFNVQSAGLSVPEDVLGAEIAKCVLICMSCRMLVLGDHRPPARIKPKELFYELRERWKAALPAPLPKSTNKRQKRRS